MKSEAAQRSLMRRRPASAARAVRLALALLTPLIGTTATWAADPCVGDCNGNDVVTVDELVTGVNIALGTASVGLCPAMDTDGNSGVEVDELVTAVNFALNGCAGATPTPTPVLVDPLIVRGGCRRPGGQGLVACASGTLVTVWRCDDRSLCPATIQARTHLGDGPTDVAGAFSIAVQRATAQGALLLMDAPIDGATVYRIMGFGPAGTGGSGGEAAAITPHGAAPALDVLIDPVGEAGVRLLDQNGLANFTDTGIPDVLDAVRLANQQTVFADLSAEAAATLATNVAREDPKVQLVIQQSMASPTPTPTPFLAPQIVTDRGCIENGDNAAYALGSLIEIFYQVDSDTIPEAEVTIIDIYAPGQGSVILSAVRPTGERFSTAATARSTTGTEALIVQAEAGNLFAQSQCSVQVVQQ